MLRYPYPKHSCRTLKDSNYYPSIDIRKIKSIYAEFRLRLGTWHLLPLARLQDMWDNDKKKLLGVSEQLLTTS
jgi:hypothetical protein